MKPDNSLGDGVYYAIEDYAGFFRRVAAILIDVIVLLWLFGPINFVLDLLWVGADSERQTLRDCYAGTYVIRKNAEPLGVAPIHLARYCAVGLTFVYPRVVRPKDSEAHGRRN